MAYKVLFHKQATKDIKKLQPRIRKDVISALENIAINPRLLGSIQLSGHTDLRRYKVNRDYRIIYRVIDEELEVLVLDAKPRGDVYKKY